MTQKITFVQFISSRITIAAIIFLSLAAVGVAIFQRFRQGPVAPTAPQSQPAAASIDSSTCTLDFAVNPPASGCLQTTKTAVLSCDAQGPLADITLGVNASCPTVTQYKPLDVMIVIDRSGSIGEALPAVRSAAQLLIEQLNPETDYVGVTQYGFEGSLVLGMSPLSDQETISNAINTATEFNPNTFDFDQGTNIGDGVFKANQNLQANRRSEATPILIVLTDGVANGRHVTAGRNFCTPPNPTAPSDCTRDAINQAQTAKDNGTAVFTIGLNMVNPSWTDETTTVARNTLIAMASSADNYFEAPTTSELNGVFDNISKVISTTAATNVIISDLLPPGISYISGTAAPIASVNGQSLKWNLGSMGQNDSSKVSFKVRFSDTNTANQLVDVFPDSVVTYTDQNSNQVSVPFPETYLSPSLACINPSPTPTPGTAPLHITVCKAIVQNNVPLTDWTNTPDSHFSIEFGENPTLGQTGHPNAYGTPFETIHFDTSESPIQNNELGIPTVCKDIVYPLTITNGGKVDITYKEEVIDSLSGWKTPRCDEGGGYGHVNIAGVQSYTGQLYDNDPNNNDERDYTCDGHLLFRSDLRHRTLLILNEIDVNALPTPIPTQTPNPNQTVSPTVTVPTSITTSPTGSSGTATPTRTSTPTATRTVTPTPTFTATSTLTSTPTPTRTTTPTNTLTHTPTRTSTPTSTLTATNSPTSTLTSTLTPNLTTTPSTTVTNNSGTPTTTQTISVSPTLTASATTTSSSSPTPTPPGLPKAGTTGPTLVLFGIGLTAIVLGVLGILFLL